METILFLEAGKYHGANLLGCFYTHKDGRKIRHWMLIDSDDTKEVVENIKLCLTESLTRRAVPGGAWSPEKTDEELNVMGCADMMKICFSPF
ncbi:hypothetical protein LCGC14_1688270 [marine sediment metagenome]|uniref:Uncharacterized protein n=1 Tax=marine sediment metagenome TaxID=412755 RepID=A0A0F9HLP3_9ZZZZ